MRVAVFSGKDPKLTSQSIETVFKNVMDEKTKMSDVKSPRFVKCVHVFCCCYSYISVVDPVLGGLGGPLMGSFQPPLN